MTKSLRHRKIHVMLPEQWSGGAAIHLSYQRRKRTTYENKDCVSNILCEARTEWPSNDKRNRSEFMRPSFPFFNLAHCYQFLTKLPPQPCSQQHRALSPLLLLSSSLPGSIILVFSIPIMPLLAEPMDSSPLGTSHIQFVDMFCGMGIFILECPRHHLTNWMSDCDWLSSITSLIVFPSLPWVRGCQRCGALYFCLSLVLLSYPHLFSSFRQIQESEAIDPAALVPLQPSTWNREHHPG